MNPTRRSFLLGAGAAVVLAACGDDGDSSAGEASSTSQTSGVPTDPPGVELGGDLPPTGPLDLEPIFGAGLADIGLKLTDRGGLVNTRDGQYVVGDPNGNHLALYAEPIGDYSTEQFIDGIVTVTVLTAPETFRRWPALESYDICQEPLPEVDDRDEPIPATQIAMTKEQVEAFDWDDVTLEDILISYYADPRGVDVLNVSSQVSTHEDYQAALDAAQEATGRSAPGGDSGSGFGD